MPDGTQHRSVHQNLVGGEVELHLGKRRLGVWPSVGDPALGCWMATLVSPSLEQRLSLAEREEISRGLAAGASLRAVAAGLGRAPSTVSREVAGNGGREQYRTLIADRAAWQLACRSTPPKLAGCARLRAVVEAKLEVRWSRSRSPAGRRAAARPGAWGEHAPGMRRRILDAGAAAVAFGPMAIVATGARAGGLRLAGADCAGAWPSCRDQGDEEQGSVATSASACGEPRSLESSALESRSVQQGNYSRRGSGRPAMGTLFDIREHKMAETCGPREMSSLRRHEGT